MSVLVTRYVFMQVGETSRHGLSDYTEVRPRQNVGLQVVRQRTLNTTRKTQNMLICRLFIFRFIYTSYYF